LLDILFFLLLNLFFNPFLKRAVFDFEMKSNYLSSKVPNNIGKEFQFNNTWINYQKKTEYNPVHHHSGVYSYVIWYQIPYYLKDEQQLYNKKFDEDNPEIYDTFIEGFSTLNNLLKEISKESDG
jgi:hypothetical protein